MAMTTLIYINNLKLNFYTYEGVVKALDGIDLEIRRGEILGLVGETGCGKSITAQSILQLVPMPPGRIEEGQVLLLREKFAHCVREAIVRDVEELEPGKKTGHRNLVKNVAVPLPLKNILTT